MSDSIKNGIESTNKNQNQIPFDANVHARRVCEDGKIQFSEKAYIDYKSGWQELVQELLTTLKSKPIMIESMISDFGQLDITFEVLKRTSETAIWKEVDYAKIRSRNICMICGDIGQRIIKPNEVIVFCRACKSAADNSGETGTWLDKF